MKKQRTADVEVAAAMGPMPGMIRTWWVMSYRLWRTTHTGKGCFYGRNPMPRWDGGVDEEGRVFKQPVWPRIAVHCGRHGLEPQQLIRAYFSGCGPQSIPVPTHLLGQPAMERYARIGRDSVDELRTELAQSMAVMRSIVTLCKMNKFPDVEAAIALQVRSSSRSLSPVFRYAILLNGGDAEGAGYFAEPALALYFFDRNSYDLAWGELIPDQLRRRADRLAAQIRRGAQP